MSDPIDVDAAKNWLNAVPVARSANAWNKAGRISQPLPRRW